MCTEFIADIVVLRINLEYQKHTALKKHKALVLYVIRVARSL